MANKPEFERGFTYMLDCDYMVWTPTLDGAIKSALYEMQALGAKTAVIYRQYESTINEGTEWEETYTRMVPVANFNVNWEHNQNDTI
jgi:hypothetical protein